MTEELLAVQWYQVPRNLFFVATGTREPRSRGKLCPLLAAVRSTAGYGVVYGYRLAVCGGCNVMHMAACGGLKPAVLVFVLCDVCTCGYG